MIMDAPITASAHTHMETPVPGYHQERAKHTVHCHGFGSRFVEGTTFTIENVVEHLLYPASPRIVPY
jgi:hypothetical protein